MQTLKRDSNGNLDPQWHGEVHQDAFAYERCGRKRDGTFLDLGCWQPVTSSNSLALEQMGWHGIMVDSDPEYTQMCKDWKRTSHIITARAEDVDWKKVCAQHGFGPVIDYLSLDVETAELETLQKLHVAGLSFRVMTVEHNRYSHGDAERDEQRRYLYSQGYILTVPDVRNSTGLEFEDWWTK